MIAVNDGFRFGDWVDVCFFGDAKWFWWNEEDLRHFKGLKVTCDRRRDPSKYAGLELFGSVRKGGQDVKFIKHSNHHGIYHDGDDRVFFNSSSGAAAINLAWHFGAQKVVLVGYDMRLIKGERNWRHHKDWTPGPKKGYENFLRPFDRIAADAKELGLEIVNATPGSGLKHFPFVELKNLCKLWTSIKLLTISWITTPALLDMAMESLSFA